MSFLPELSIAASKKRKRTTQLQFPSDLGDYCMILSFIEYDYSTARSNTQGHVGFSVAFPLPSNLLDSSRIDIGGRQVGTMGQLVADISSGLDDLRGSGSSIKALGSELLQAGTDAMGAAAGMAGNMVGPEGIKGDEIIEAFQKGVGTLKSVGGYALRGVASKLTPQVAQAFGATVGNAMNPHQTLVFDGVDLKIHNFDWTFAPRNQAETDELGQIINTIQYYIHPEYKSPLNRDVGIESIDRGLLDYPALLKVQLLGLNQKFVVNFNKFMMVQQFNVDYTSNGLSLNRGGNPAMVRCNMNVMETQIRTKDDYSENAGFGSAITQGALDAGAASKAANQADSTEAANGSIRTGLATSTNQNNLGRPEFQDGPAFVGP